MAATGAGLAPLLAMLRELRAAGGAPRSASTTAPAPGMPYADELERPAAPTLGASSSRLVELARRGPAAVRAGALVRRIGRDVPDASGYDAYVAGPVPCATPSKPS